MIKSEYNYRYDIQVKINCEHCEKCNGYMFETEILKLFETLIAKEKDDIEIG